MRNILKFVIYTLKSVFILLISRLKRLKMIRSLTFSLNIIKNYIDSADIKSVLDNNLVVELLSSLSKFSIEIIGAAALKSLNIKARRFTILDIEVIVYSVFNAVYNTTDIFNIRLTLLLRSRPFLRTY